MPHDRLEPSLTVCRMAWEPSSYNANVSISIIAIGLVAPGA